MFYTVCDHVFLSFHHAGPASVVRPASWIMKKTVTIPFQTLLAIDKSSKAPAYQQLADKLIALIQDGKILPGAYLPGTRQMAAILTVNRKTVTRAYEDLIAQDWIETLPQKGYRIIPELPLIKPRSFQPKDNFQPADPNEREIVARPNNYYNVNYGALKSADIVINDGYPDIELLPYNELLKQYRKQFNKKNLRQQMILRDDGGIQTLKLATCNFLNESRGLNVSENAIVITRGAQMAIYIAVTLLLKPGDKVAVSDPSYSFADRVLSNAGVEPVLVPIDEEGMDMDYLEALLKSTDIKLLYIVPHHHHPTTVTMSAARRLKLLQLIKTYQFWVVEDDYDYDFHFEKSPILPLASADHGGKIIYIGSYTKLLAPSFRIGYMVGAPAIIRKAINLRLMMDLRGDTFMEQTLADMINNGDLSKHIKKTNKSYADRCAFTCRLLQERLGDKISFRQPNGGLAIWIKFNKQTDMETLIKKAAAAGLYIISTIYVNEGNPNHNGLRFGFASLTENEIEKAVNILSRLVV